HSKIVFPDASLSFTNEFGHFQSEVARAFPAQKDNFARLAKLVGEYDELNLTAKHASGRETISSIITDPLLAEMIMCPLLFYGGSREEDMDFGQFVVMFKSLFFEGFARPSGGMKTVLGLLMETYAKHGGELRLETGVRQIVAGNGAVQAVVTDMDETIECGRVFSSAGLWETVALCPEASPGDVKTGPGRLSFMEAVYVLDRPARELGEEASIIFFNNASTFSYKKPDEPLDLRSGVICFPGNFGENGVEGSPMARLTSIADYGYWMGIENPREYLKSKIEWSAKALKATNWVTPDFSRNVVFRDVFTPKTIKRYTGHINGAVYGAPDKMKTGETPVTGLYIIGTDQGFLGIVGAMLSGITVANLRLTHKD
ncbi:MAG: phytoene dehydrogenase, partial [Nitrospinae bacterium]|nr:phytoene dehydrogenase [Nitrospinota bacterium]